MGEVYRARDTNLRRDVAIKTLPPALATVAERLARFEYEAQSLAILVHAHIARSKASANTPARGRSSREA